MWGSLSSLLPEVLSGLTSNPWYFRALEIHLYKTWTKKGRKPGGHELPLVRQMTCSFINETITLEGGSKRIPSSLYNPQFSQAIPFNWAMTMEYLIVAWKFQEDSSSESMFISGLWQAGISAACGDGAWFLPLSGAWRGFLPKGLTSPFHWKGTFSLTGLEGHLGHRWVTRFHEAGASGRLFQHRYAPGLSSVSC